MANLITTFFLFLFIIYNGYSQSIENTKTSGYLTFQTGVMYDSYNSVGIRTFFEYQKDLPKNWQYGISYEHTTHFGNGITDQHNQLPTNLSLFCLNGYYKLNLIKDRLFWTTGIGMGFVHVNWNESNKFGSTINLSMTLNIRVSKKIYLEFAPLILIAPVNRFYFSTINIEGYNNFWSFTLFPIGIKVKL